jgi:two-component system cell cycle sensor histidine kinase/response regulator CckA
MRHLANGTNTERNATEQLLVVEGRLELAQQVARMGYWDWDTATDTVECSDELYRIFGLTLPADGGAEYTAFQGVHPDDLSSVQEAIRIGLETHQPYEVEHRVVHPNGDERAVVARGVASYGADSEPTRVFGISYDVTEHRQAERELRARNALYRDLFEAAGDMIFLTDLDGGVRSVNRAAEEALDYPRDHLSGRSVFEALMSESDAQVARAHLDSVIAGSSESEFLAISFIAEDGTEIPVESSTTILGEDGSPDGLLWIARDQRERNSLEGQLRQAQKMDAVGSLAAGIAHDFNNVLLVILGLSEIVMAQSSDEAVQRNVGKIDQAAQHAAELTHQLLAFSRQQVLRPEVTDLNGVVEEALGVLTRTLGENIDVRRDLDPALQQILIDRSQLMQVVYNLAVNARDAMPSGGTLTIQTTNTELDETFARAHPGVTAGPHVLLQLGDSGHGMDEETRSRVFDPFFTTKGEGTGLGLATVYGIVRQSGGYIWLYSEPGLGTIFKIYLPSTTQKASEPREPQPQASLHGTGKILVVEDEEMVRLLVAELLESFGYEVHSASGPKEALQLADEELRSFDVLMTDIVMPGMTGRELAEQLAAIHPTLRVLFTSGYPEDVAIRTEIGEARAHFIDKPYRSAELAEIVQRMLAGASPD